MLNKMNQVELENEFFKVVINKLGAEICSFYSKKSSIEYIWSGDSSVWGSTAPVLFPIIGALKDGYFEYEGKKFSVPKHGFIRNNEDLIWDRVSENGVKAVLESNDKLKQIYPFDFRFEISFLLNEKGELKVIHKVINLSNEKPLYFSLGAHPAFSCPFNKEEKYNDFYIEFDKNETINQWQVLSDGTIGVNSKPFLKNEKIVNLKHDLFLKDAIVLKSTASSVVSLKSRKNNNYIKLTYKGFDYLGIWAKPNGDFVCIEPWLGISDSCTTNNQLITKEGIQRLEKGSSFEIDFKIQIIED